MVSRGPPASMSGVRLFHRQIAQHQCDVNWWRNQLREALPFWQRGLIGAAMLLPFVSGSTIRSSINGAEELAKDAAKHADEAADAGEALLKHADELGDAAKSAGKSSGSGFKVNVGQQEKHITGTNNFNQSVNSGKNRSILNDDAQSLLDQFAGKGQKLGANKERINFGKVIGQYYDAKTGKYVDTTNGIIHYDANGGAHIVPAKP